jgi:hypothetical protein
MGSDESQESMKKELADLFRTFLSGPVADRCCTLLEMKPARWGGIDPWRAWDQLGTGRVHEWKRSVKTLLTSPTFEPFVTREVTVLRCGHADPSLERIALRDALIGASSVFEGFVVVVPGELGLALNHDGDLCVLCRTPPKAD